jgi:general secretion pathway protein J
VLAQWEPTCSAARRPHRAGAGLRRPTLRLTRRADGGVQLVAWSLRRRPLAALDLAAGRHRAGDLQEAWLRSQQLQGTSPGNWCSLGVSIWQVYFYRGNAWTNAQSTGDLRRPPAAAPAPPGAPAVEQLPTACGWC